MPYFQENGPPPLTGLMKNGGIRRLFRESGSSSEQSTVTKNRKKNMKRLAISAAMLRSAAAGVQSVVNKNQYGRRFFTLFGNTFDIKEDIKSMGFKFFKGTWSKPVDAITEDDKTKMTSLGIDLSPMDVADIQDHPAVSGQPAGTQAPAPAQEPKEETAVESELSKMKSGIQTAMKQSGGRDKVAALLDFIEESIEKIANLADESAKSEFIKNFLSFAAKFHDYSFSNQIMIWIQNPLATYVNGFKKWMSMGRQVVDFKKKIIIIAPFTNKKKYSDEQLAGLSQGEIDSLPQTYTTFAPVDVYDVSNTEVIPGWEQQTKKKPFEPADWRKDSNDPLEEITALVNAVRDWAVSQNIDVGAEAMESNLGGYSTGGKIRVNDKYEGINLFSTMVHECAHEILHWTDARKKGARDTEGRKVKEIDAETTAYVVLQHYGFETTDAPNYLALWKASGEEIRNRRNNISRAVGTIVSGIEETMGKSIYQDSPEAETKAETQTVTASGKRRLLISASSLRRLSDSRRSPRR